MTTGLMLLSAIRKLRSRAALHEVGDDLLQTPDERAVAAFLREFITEHHTFPNLPTIFRHTRIRLPVTDEPYTYYLADTRNRALYAAIREPFAALEEALKAGNRPAMQQAAEAIRAMDASVNRFVGTGSGIETSDTVLERVRDEFHLAQTDHGLRGVTSGWAEVDRITLGYQPEDLIVWVGRPGRGKSWLQTWQAYHAWRAGYRVLYISMEMSAEAIMRRMVGMHSGINPHLIRSGQIQTQAVPIVERAFAEMMEINPINLATANFNRSMDQVNGFIERYMPDIIYIDAGYLLKPNQKRYGSSGRRETISDTIEEQKQSASNYHRPVHVTVQFNRIAEQRRRGAHNRGEQADDAEAPRSTNIRTPVSHLGLDLVGETDVISQTASHAFGIDLPPPPLFGMRGFGFLKGREGEDGQWYCNYPDNTSSTIDLSIVPWDDPRLVAAMADDTQPRRRQRPQANTNLGFMDGPRNAR